MRNRLEYTRQRRTQGEPFIRTLPALASAIVVTLGLALGASAQAADAAAGAPGDATRQAAVISALSISGNSTFSNSQLQRAMGISAAGWFSRGDDYSKARLSSALANLRSFYISRGYLRFMVREVKTVPAPDGKTVAVSIMITEGQLYTLGSAKLTGDAGDLASAPGMTEALQRALPVGQPVSREGLEAARRAIIAQLGHEGYAHASVSPRFTTDDANARIALTFQITRGQPSAAQPPKSAPEAQPPQTQPILTPPPTTPVPPTKSQPAAQPPQTPPTPPILTPPPVTPVPPTKSQPAAQTPQTPPVLTPPPVTPVPPTKSQPAAQTPQTPPVLTPPPVTPVPPTKSQPAAQTPQTPPTPPSQPPQAEQNLDLIDRREITLGASAGYSSADRVIGMLSARYLNAFGKGHDLTADIAGGKTYRAARLSESDRWFTPSGVSRTTSLWYRADQPFYYLNNSRFRASGTGLTERFDIPMTAADSVYLAPGVERDWLHTDGLTPQAYLNHIDRYGPALNVATLRAGWTHDMRDSASLPTRGYIAQGDAELGLGNASYLKAYASGRYYHPLWGDTVLSVSGLGGFGQGLSSKGYPIEKYFYAGGIGSVRGYATNSLGSRDLGTNFPLGGRRLLTSSLEAVTPLTAFKPDLPGRLVWLLFVDGGNVWSNGLGGTSAGSARFAYGTGLGWQIPFGTLQLSFALPVTRHPGDDYQRFQVEFNAGF